MNQRIINSNKNNQHSTSDLLLHNKINTISAHTNQRLGNGVEIDSDGSEHSQLSAASKLSSNSVLSAQSEFIKGANNRKLSGLTTSDANRQTHVSKNAANTTTTTTTKVPSLTEDPVIFTIDTSTQQQVVKPKVSEKTDGTLSDSALTNPISTIPETLNNKKRRPSMAKALVILGLSKKSNSASNLTLGKRFGFARSEEYGVMPELRNRNLSPSSGDSGAEDKKPRYFHY